MARNRKLFIHGIPYELTFRTESGLPFPAIPLIKYAMESILARAQTLYGVEITAVLLMLMKSNPDPGKGQSNFSTKLRTI